MLNAQPSPPNNQDTVSNANCSALSIQYAFVRAQCNNASTEHSMLNIQCSILNAEHPALNPHCSMLKTQCLDLSSPECVGLDSVRRISIAIVNAQ